MDICKCFNAQKKEQGGILEASAALSSIKKQKNLHHANQYLLGFTEVWFL